MRPFLDRAWSHWPGVVLALLPLAFLWLGMVWPVWYLLTHGAQDVAGISPANTSGWLWQDPYLRWRVVWTLTLALATTSLCAILGLPLAWLLTRWEWPLRRALLQLVMLPFVVPTLVAAIGLLAVWGPHGWLARGFPALAGEQQGPWLLLLGYVFFNVGIVVKAGAMGLATISRSRVAAARTLGASGWRAFWRVEWPSLLPHLLAALCVVFLYSFGSFGLALVLGGPRYATLEVEIYTRVAYDLDLAGARQLAALSASMMLAAVLAQAWWGARLAQPSRDDPVPARHVVTLWQWGWVVAGAGVLAFICVVPLVAVLVQSLMAFDTLPDVLTQADTLLALANTLRFGGMAVCLALLISTSLAFSAFRFKWLRPILALPLVASPVTIGFGYLVAYPVASAHLSLLIVAYALLAIPLMAPPLLAALDTLPMNAYWAARSLGATRWRAFVRVTLPPLQPALRRGIALALACCLGEFAITLFLSRPEWTTLGTLIYHYLGRPGQANFEAAIVLSGCLMAITLLLFWLIDPPAHALTTPD